MAQPYDETFFDWVDMTATRSARIVIPVVRAAFPVSSVVDVGCGRGAWLAVWSASGVTDILGIDGAYVDAARLAIPRDVFQSADLTIPLTTPRRFDLAQCLEVAEHLPSAAAPALIQSLCRLADVVLFSAATPGQGGENHINEQPTSEWAARFAAQGYAAFDLVRPALASEADVDPWYRYNSVMYANAAGAARLSDAARASKVDVLDDLDGAGDLAWRLRSAILRPLPVPVVSGLSRLRYALAIRQPAPVGRAS